MTSKQRAVLELILESVARSGRFPSYREIGCGLGGLCVGTVFQHLGALARRGLLLRKEGRLILAPHARRERAVPIVGSAGGLLRNGSESPPAARSEATALVRAMAGRRIPSTAEVTGFLGWDSLGAAGCFAVRVTGNDLSSEGILDEDFALVDPDAASQAGDLVLAYVGKSQKAVLGRLSCRGSRAELSAAGERLAPTRLDEPHSRVAGRLVGIVRRPRRSPRRMPAREPVGRLRRKPVRKLP